MTNKEAIEILKTALCDDCGYMCGKDEKCMFKKAIEFTTKALSAEPCEDTISREAVLELIDDHSGGYKYIEEETEYLKNSIRELPYVSPTRKGKWIKSDTYSETTADGMEDWGEIYKCSICGIDRVKHRHKYCPNCGAKMFEPMESEDKE